MKTIKGQQHYYCMMRRPFDIGCQPREHKEVHHAVKSRDGFHSIISYTSPLADEELEKYELARLEDVKPDHPFLKVQNPATL